MDNRKEVVLCDLDGTLCNIDHRLHFIQGENKDYDSFYYGCGQDKVDIGVRRWLIRLYPHYRIFIVSGRRWTCLFATIDWLANNYIEVDHIFMPRGVHDYRPDTEIKKGILEEIIDSGYKIAFAIDDRPSVVKMWRANGVKVYPVNQHRWGL